MNLYSHWFRLGLSSFVFLICLSALTFVDSRELTPDGLKSWLESLRALIWVFLFFEVLLTGWLAWCVKKGDIYLKYVDLVVLGALTAANIVLFAACYKASGLQIQGEFMLPSTEDAFYFSVGVFSGSISPIYRPEQDIADLIAIETVIGLLFLPVFLSLLFAVLTGRPPTPPKRDMDYLY